MALQYFSFLIFENIYANFERNSTRFLPIFLKRKPKTEPGKQVFSQSKNPEQDYLDPKMQQAISNMFQIT
jgi:hypothetical protein